MPVVDVVVKSEINQSYRVRQLESMFDVPPQKIERLEFQAKYPDDDDWNIGLIVGPSGSGKSTIMRKAFGEEPTFSWDPKKAVIEEIGPDLEFNEVTSVCSAVGFNTIPAWRRPFHVLSNGEKFRARMARLLLMKNDPLVVDEFTSVVDRKVAKIASYAVQKHVRRTNKRFVAVTCHYDVSDWLDPDWVIDMASLSFERRRCRRISKGSRPEISASIRRASTREWSRFSRFHYMTANLPGHARCWILEVNREPAAFLGMINQIGSRSVFRVSRLVTVPDFQGLGLAFILAEKIGAAFRAFQKRIRCYPAHPPFIQNYKKSPVWKMCKAPGFKKSAHGIDAAKKMGHRPCAIFEYAGKSMALIDAKTLLFGQYKWVR